MTKVDRSVWLVALLVVIAGIAAAILLTGGADDRVGLQGMHPAHQTMHQTYSQMPHQNYAQMPHIGVRSYGALVDFDDMRDHRGMHGYRNDMPDRMRVRGWMHRDLGR